MKIMKKVGLLLIACALWHSPVKCGRFLKNALQAGSDLVKKAEKGSVKVVRQNNR